MNENLLLIICAVGVVALIYLIRYIIAKVVYKGTDALNRDTTFFSAAAVLLVPAELLDFKFRVMKWKGFKMIEPPISARSNFMRDMAIPEDADFYS